MAVRRRRLEAERERDIAIEEAAVAYHELSQLRREVEQLRGEKAAWEAGQDAWSQRHEQILWHVGAMAEMLWCAFQQSHDGSSSSRTSVEDAKLLALESFAQLTPKSDARVYEEMHELYAKIAHMEAQHTKMAEKLRQLKRMNEELLASQRDCAEPHISEDAHAARAMKGEMTRGMKGGRDHDPAQAVGPAEIHPLPEILRRDEALPQERPPSETPVVELLQAQLLMYINYTKRHCQRERTGNANRIDR